MVCSDRDADIWPGNFLSFRLLVWRVPFLVFASALFSILDGHLHFPSPHRRGRAFPPGGRMDTLQSAGGMHRQCTVAQTHLFLARKH